MSKKENIPLWVFGTSLVESEMLNRPRRMLGWGTAIVIGLAFWSLVALVFGGTSC